jgi:hypothetical protein
LEVVRMANTTFASLVLNPKLEEIPDRVLIEFAAYIRKCGIQIVKVKKKDDGVTAICKKGKLKARIIIDKGGFRVVKIYQYPTPCWR